MLKHRIATAIVMLAVVLGALLAPSPIPAALLLVLISTCAAWEWLRLVLLRARTAVWLAAALGILLLVLTVQWLGIGSCIDLTAQTSVLIPSWGFCPREARAFWSLWTMTPPIFILLFMPWVVLIWCIGAPLSILHAQRRGVSLSHPAPHPDRASAAIKASIALVAIAVTCFSLTLLYDQSPWLLLSCMALVWCADIGAYFSGKTWGRHTLASQVSPGKTWQGAAGGIVAALAWTLATAALEGSFGALLLQRYSLVDTVLLTVLLAALSIVGDLYESLLKRRAGVKDSSGLLPGHGGVLDRIDALLPVAPAACYLLRLGFD